MFRQHHPLRLPWIAGLICALLGVTVLVGCSSPQERYRVLSYFFDGVPDPNAPQKVVHQENTDETGPVMVTAAVMSRHDPYMKNQCATCHESSAGIMMDFEQGYKQCVKCHPKAKESRPLMHGPVAHEACEWCHAPHESNEPALLKDTPIAVCTPCHDKNLLGDNPAEHRDGTTSCLKCHFGHGGTARHFLKPVTAALEAPVTALPGPAQSQPSQTPVVTP